MGFSRIITGINGTEAIEWTDQLTPSGVDPRACRGKAFTPEHSEEGDGGVSGEEDSTGMYY